VVKVHTCWTAFLIVFSFLFQTQAQYQEPQESISAILECVGANSDGTYTAWFGYYNRNDYDVLIPIGEDNKITGLDSWDQGQTSVFKPGRVRYAFSIVFPSGTIVWTLESTSRKTSTASSSAASSDCNAPSGLEVVIVSPTDGTLTNQTSVDVVWTVDGVEQTTETTEELTIEGENTITRSATDQAGNTTTASVTVIRDTQAPEVAITSPSDGMLTNLSSVSVTWTVDGIEQTDQLTETLIEGTNAITRTATDEAGNTGTASVQVTADFTAPVVEITSPVDGDITNVSPVDVTWSVDGVEQTTQLSETLNPGANTIVRSSTDDAGNEGIDSVTITYDAEGPEVVIVSPSEGILTNQTSVDVVWTVDGVEQTTETTEVLTIEGENTISRSATDQAGNTTTASVTVIRDTQAPLVAITSPSDGALTNQSSINVTWTVDGIEQTDQLTATLSEGTNTITRTATDEAGNTGSASIEVTADFTAPEVAITSPSDGMLTNLSSVSVTWTVDGIEQTDQLTETLTEGTNTITRTASDEAGNTGTASVEVTADFTAPVVSITAPADGDITNVSPVEVTWTVDGVEQTTQLSETLNPGANTIVRSSTDAAGNEGIASVTITYDAEGPEVVIVSPTDGTLTNQTSVDVVWTIDGVEQTTEATEDLTIEGENTITRSATDQAGNTTTASVTVIRDTQAPEVAITSPLDGSLTNQPSIIVTWTVDGIEQTEQLTETLIEGANTITRTATDEAGNTGSASIEVTADFTAPVVTITAPGDGDTVSTTPVQVVWTIDGIVQDSLTEETVTVGFTEIIRTGADAVGHVASDTVTVYMAPAGVVISDTVDTIPEDFFDYDDINLTIVNSDVRIRGEHCFDTIRLENATLEIDSCICANEMLVLDSSVITHPETDTVNVYRVCLDIMGRLIVDGTSRIDVDGRGYLGDRRAGDHWIGARTAGNVDAGISSSSIYTVASGSHGGKGGAQHYDDLSIDPYDSPIHPSLPGTGGGALFSDNGSIGGDGGGVIRVSAGLLVLDGTITSDGTAGTRLGASGAGGSIYIECDTLTGLGGASASGGLTGNSGGGGGRIAVHVRDSLGMADTAFLVHGPQTAETGTVSLIRGESAARTVLLVAHDESKTEEHSTNFVVTATDGLDSVRAIDFRAVSVRYDTKLIADSLTCTGSVAKLDGGCSAVSIRITDTSVVTTGGEIAAVTVTLTDSGIINHPAGSPESTSRVALACDTLIVGEHSGFDVSGLGLPGGYTLGGEINGNRPDQGGSHGGRGAYGRDPYGSAETPILPGAGGSYPMPEGTYGGAGGGVVRIDAEVVHLDGFILADGERGKPESTIDGQKLHAGGAGGSIWITADSLSGSGAIHADGGLGSGTIPQGRGGGGRIALYACTLDTALLDLSVAGFESGTVHIGDCGDGVDTLRPVVLIEKPLNGAAVRTPQIDVEWSVDGFMQTENLSETLAHGMNEIVRSAENPLNGKTGRDTILVELDTVAPVVSIQSPADSAVRVDSIADVVWYVDGQYQISERMQPLEYGWNSIVRASEDRAGNIGADTVSVYRATRAPDLVSITIVPGIDYDSTGVVLDGYADITLYNAGSLAVPAPHRLVVVENSNGNKLIGDEEDALLGGITVETVIIPGDSLVVTVPLSGTVRFLGNHLYAVADFDDSIPETNEENNIQSALFECNPPNTLSMQREWAWDPSDSLDADVFGSPVVVQLNDDNLDGLIDKNDIPDIVAVGIWGGVVKGTYLCAAGGDGSGELFRVDLGSSALKTDIAAGDIDNDGLAEIVVAGITKLQVFENDGTLKWSSNDIQVPCEQEDINCATLGSWLRSVALADLDGDGTVEIIVGRQVFDADGNLLWEGTGGVAKGYATVVDLDMDGVSEVLAGNTAYRADGSIWWRNEEVPDGFAAVADLDDDNLPELVVTGWGEMYALEHDGTIIWGPVSLPDREGRAWHTDNYGGYPVIADIDNDAEPEILVGAHALVAYEKDGTLKWGHELLDWNGLTSCGVLDVDGNGTMEVFHADEDSLRVFRGTDGVVIHAENSHTNTWVDFPVVADVDNDGEAEVLFIGNAQYGSNGVNIYGSGPGSTWSGTRSIWNQYTYHGTNVTDNGGIPPNEEPSWRTTNSFRVNHAELREQCVDLTGSLASVSEISNGDTARFSVRVGNAGAVSVRPSIPVSFFRGSPGSGEFLGTVYTGTALTGGDWEDVRLSVGNDFLEGWHDFYAVVDSDSIGNDLYAESDEINNTATFRSYLKNGVPVVSSIPDATIDEGDLYTQQVSAGDPDNDPLHYSLTSRPAGMSIDTLGALSWQTDSIDAGLYEIVVQVADNKQGTARDTFALKVRETWNVQPVFGPSVRLSAEEGAAFAYDVHYSVSDADNDPLTFALVRSPSGMTINNCPQGPCPGVLRWTPAADQAGSHEIEIAVNDGRSADVSGIIYIDVAEAINAAPVIVSTPPDGVMEGGLYRYTVAATDAEGDSVRYRLDSTTSSGVALDTVSGDLEWTPTASDVGVQTHSVTAYDIHGATDGQTITVTVTPSVNEAPVIVSTPDTVVNEEDLWEYMIEASDPENDALTYHLDTAPFGMAVDASGTVTWTPDDNHVGDNVVVVEVHDEAHVTKQSFTLQVLEVNDAPAITSLPVDTIEAGVPYVYEVRTHDADDEDLTFALSTAPQGMSVSAQGIVSWPDDGNREDWAPVELTVTDDSGAVAVQSWTVTVIPDTESPAVTIATSRNPAYPYSTVDITVSATDNAGIDSVTLLIDSIEVELDENDTYRYETGDEGEVELIAEAVDIFGNTGSVTSLLRVSVDADTSDPVVEVTGTPSYAQVGDIVTFTVTADDDIEIDRERVWLLVDGEYLTLRNGIAQWRSRKRGTYEAVATAYDLQGNYGEGRTTVTVDLTGSDNTPPQVAITAPPSDTVLYGPTEVFGTAADENFAYYTLTVIPCGGTEAVTFADVETEVRNGLLGTIDPGVLENGDYRIRLTAWDRYGNGNATERMVRVTGNRKLGVFSLSFDDMTVGLPGMDLTFTRTYDSRNKSDDGDFGYGWRIGVRSIRVSENTQPGNNWDVYDAGGELICVPGFGCAQFPGYVAVPMGTNTVTITIPGGRDQVFDVVAELYDPWDPRYGRIRFAPRPGTYSTLEHLDGGDFIVQGDDLYDLYGDLDEPFDPDKYKLTLKDGTYYIIDQNAGGVVKYGDLNGNEIDISDSRIAHSSGPDYSIVRDEQGRITQMSDTENRTVSYTYDGHGNLQTVTDPKGNVTRFKYAPNHYLLEIEDPRGIRAVRTEYDDLGRLVRQIDPMGDTVYFDHDSENNREIIGQVDGSLTEYVYDERGNVLFKTDDSGNTWEYAYDSLDNLVATDNPDGTRRTASWDDRGDMVNETDENTRTTTYTYNDRGQMVREALLGRYVDSEYDSAGNLISTTISNANGSVTTSNTYDLYGNVLTETDGEGNVTRYEYDGWGRMIARVDPLGRRTEYVLDSRGNTLAEIGPKGDTTKFSYDVNDNQVMSVSPLGDTTTTTYNEFDKAASTTDARGNVTRYEYDVYGQLVRTIAPDSSVTERFYDGRGNLRRTIDEVGRETRFEYDHENRLIRTIFNDGSVAEQEYDARGRRIASIDRNGNRTEYEYDGVGNNTLVRDALGIETKYQYTGHGLRRNMADALGQKTSYFYDMVHQLTTTVYEDGTRSEIEYDNAGRKTAEIDAEGKRTEFAYDAVGNLTSVTDAMGFVTSYTYDKNNNRTSQTDANGHTTSMEYDELNRLVKRIYPNPEGNIGTGADEERFGYDANGSMVYKVTGSSTPLGDRDSTAFAYDSRNRETYRWYSNSGHTVETKYTADSKRDTVIDHRGIADYDYNTDGRLEVVTNPDNTFIQYAYDSNGNKTEMSIPWGTTHYSFDPLNRMKTVTAQNGDVTEYFYNEVGNRDSVSNANGTATGYQYDNLNRLTDVVNYGPSGAVISSFGYELNNAGIRTAVNEADGSRVDYNYDDLYRLTGESRASANPYSIAYSYDAVGNRLTKDRDGVVTSYTYNNRDQLVSESNPGETITSTYDAAGRLSSKTDNNGTTTYGWEDNDRMVSVTGPGVAVTYEYDFDGRRVRETNGFDVRNYLIDSELRYGQVIAETDGSGQLVVDYVYGLERISQNRGGAITFYVADGQGSTRQLTNASGAVTDSWLFDAFGNIESRTGATENQFLYVGEQWNPNVGFYYNRARWLNPETGRFVSVDPWAGDPQSPVSLHRYLYANSSPMLYVDPTGQWSLVEVMTTVYVQAVNTSRAVVVYVGTTFYAGRALVRIGVASLRSWISGQTLMPQVKAAADSMYPKLATMGTHGHHVIPQYVARAFKIPINQTLVHIPASVHQYFTNAIAIPFPLRNPTANITQLPQAMNALMKAYDVAIKNLLAGVGG